MNKKSELEPKSKEFDIICLHCKNNCKQNINRAIVRCPIFKRNEVPITDKKLERRIKKIEKKKNIRKICKYIALVLIFLIVMGI